MRNLKIQTLPSKNWIDKDEILSHACFQLLVDFVEKEKGLDCEIYEVEGELINGNVDRIKILNVLKELYAWWKGLDYDEFDSTKHQDKLKLLIEHNTSLWI